MDYKGQSELLLKDAAEFAEYNVPGYIVGDLRQASKSITDLLARAEAAERKAEELSEALSSASKVVRTMQENTIPYYRKREEAAEKEVEWKNKVIEAAERRFMAAEARAENAERERDAAIEEIPKICYYCKHRKGWKVCEDWNGNQEAETCEKWEWRGQKEE